MLNTKYSLSPTLCVRVAYGFNKGRTSDLRVVISKIINDSTMSFVSIYMFPCLRNTMNKKNTF